MKCPVCGRELPEAAGPCPACAAAAERPTRTGDGSGAAVAAPLPRLAAGNLLASRYRIVGFAGRGGMAEVYRAEDAKLRQTVALKMLPSDLEEDDERLSRLLNEVRLARQVSHPHVCRVYDVGEAGGRHFLSMEWIEGENLAERLQRKGRLPEEDAVRIAWQISAGLSAAHERGVLHRDLKPSNVMIDERGVARITDFGLAEAAAVVRGSRAREGTPAYMAPEQLEGGEVTSKSDLYALGLVLYELFTGISPRTGNEVAVWLREAPRPPSEIVPDLDPRIGEVVLACLERDPSRRPASARQVAEALPGGRAISEALGTAQRRADQIAAFRAELAELRRSGLLKLEEETIEPIERYHESVLNDLVRRYAVDVGERGKHISLAMRMASFVASLAFAASVFYFFFSVWGAIPFSFQVGILTAAPILMLAGTAAAAARESSGAVTSVLGLAAVACFVLDIVALGSALDLPGSPLSFLIWGSFALLVAYAYQLRLPLAAGLIGLSIFLAGTVHHLAGGHWTLFVQGPESLIVPGALALAAALAGSQRQPQGFGAVYRVAAVVLLLAPCVIVAQTGASYLPIGGRAAGVVYQVAGFLASAGLVWLGVSRLWREVIYGATLAFVVLLFFRFVAWWWDWMPRYLFFFIVALAAFASLWVLKRLHLATVRREVVAR